MKKNTSVSASPAWEFIEMGSIVLSEWKGWLIAYCRRKLKLVRKGLIRLYAKYKAPCMEEFMQRRCIELDVAEADQYRFRYVYPGSKRVPNRRHQKRVSELFEFLGKNRRERWNQVKLKTGEKDYQKEHALAELTSLRSEIVDLKSQITNSEKLIAAWIVGAVVMYSKDIIPHVWVLVLPLIFSVFGFLRFREFQRNVFDLDCYLREIEHALRLDTGWVNYFFRTRQMEKFFQTRAWFWWAANIFAASILALGLIGLTEYDKDNKLLIRPQPIAVEILPAQSSDKYP